MRKKHRKVCKNGDHCKFKERCEFKHTLNRADKPNSLIDDLKKTVQELQSGKIKSENKINNLEVIRKAFRADKVIPDKNYF